MSEVLEARAERLKLARLLQVDESALDIVATVPSAELREFRESATNRLYDAAAKAIGKVGPASALVPSAIIATIAVKAFGPVLCALAAGPIDPKKAVDVARRLPPDFLADVSVALDPRRTADIIAAVPREVTVPVARELGEREEYVTMGRFLAFVADDAIDAAMGELSDEALLRTAFVLEHKDRLDHATSLLPAERIPSVLVRASELGLWGEALDLLEHLEPERRGPIADTLAGLDHDVIATLVETVDDQGLWDTLLPIVQLMSPEACTRLAQAPAFHSPVVLGSVIRSAADQSLWADLVPLVDALPDDVRALVAQQAAALPAGAQLRIIEEALAAPDTVPTLLGLARHMTAGDRARMVATLDDPVVARLRSAAEALGLAAEADELLTS